MAGVSDEFYLLHELLTSEFQNKLRGEPLKYLSERGMTSDTIAKYRLGYWHPDIDMRQYREIGFNGTALGSVMQQKPYMKERLIFPLTDIMGRPIAFAGRVLEPVIEGQAKYINSPNGEHYSKMHFLYGLDKAFEAIKAKRMAFVVEGYFDVLAMHQAGFAETVGVCGTAVTEFQIYQLFVLGCRELALFFDGDAAGERAEARAEMLARELGMETRSLRLADFDPASFLTGGL